MKTNIITKNYFNPISVTVLIVLAGASASIVPFSADYTACFYCLAGDISFAVKLQYRLLTSGKKQLSCGWENTGD